MTVSERAFFLPDGDGGQWSKEKTIAEFPAIRDAAIASSSWDPASFTGRYVWRLKSQHHGRDYEQIVGQLTSDRRFVILILESLDEIGRRRFAVLTMRGIIHVDPQKVVDVLYFDSAPSPTPEGDRSEHSHLESNDDPGTL